VVSQDALPYLEGVEVDYRREGLNAAFRFNNPNVKASCGCGESFTV
jgi:iron-sulfur cluster assembly protein